MTESSGKFERARTRVKVGLKLTVEVSQPGAERAFVVVFLPSHPVALETLADDELALSFDQAAADGPACLLITVVFHALLVVWEVVDLPPPFVIVGH